MALRGFEAATDEELIGLVSMYAREPGELFESPAPLFAVGHLMRALEAMLARQSADTGSAEWEYGYTTKWGTYAASSKGHAEASASALRESIAGGQESGDLKHHGHIVRRIIPKRGDWIPVGGTE